jgi:hypothetical protein
MVIWLGGGGYAGAYYEHPGFDLELSAMVGSAGFFTHIAYVTDDLRWCEHILEADFASLCRNRDWIITAGMGTLVHELGHTFGLGHEDDHQGAVPPNAFMSGQWNYFQIRSVADAPDSLSEPYKEIVRASRFFAPTSP